MIKKSFFDFIIIPIFRICDFFISKKDNYWAFSVHHIKSNQFIENQRAIFESVKKDSNIKKIIFTRDNTKEFHLEDFTNTEIIKLHTIRGFYLLSKCRVLFLSHSISMDFSIRYGKKLFSIVKPQLKSRVIVNLWHGIPLKKLLALTNENVKKTTNRVKFNRKERTYYSGLISSSDIDSYSMTTMFYPVEYKNVWITGLPRNDFLLQKEEALPTYLKEDIKKLEIQKNDKKLILYAPTYRQSHIIDSASYYQFSEEEMNSLKKLLRDNNAILGFRMHYFRNSDNLFNIEDYIDNETFFDLGHNHISEIAACIRVSDIVVTDYSSIYIDALYLNKAVFSFAYDLEDYQKNQDGLLYDLEIAFPSKINKTFDKLLTSLEDELKNINQNSYQNYKTTQKLFFNYIDTNNSKRVTNKIKSLLKN